MMKPTMNKQPHPHPVQLDTSSMNLSPTFHIAAQAVIKPKKSTVEPRTPRMKLTI